MDATELKPSTGKRFQPLDDAPRGRPATPPAFRSPSRAHGPESVINHSIRIAPEEFGYERIFCRYISRYETTGHGYERVKYDGCMNFFMTYRNRTMVKILCKHPMD